MAGLRDKSLGLRGNGVMVNGQSVRIYFPDGNPDGLAECELLNWTGHIFKFRRAILSDFLARQEAIRSGVYILIGSDPETSQDVIYIGESDKLGERLKQHSASTAKDFWDSTYVICSKDLNLTKSHILFLESFLQERMIESGRYPLKNVKNSGYDKLPPSDTSYSISFAKNVQFVLTAIGFDVFVPARVGFGPQHEPTLLSQVISSDGNGLPSANDREPLRLALRDRRTGFVAYGIESDGKILILKGSEASLELRGLNTRLAALRQQMIEQGILLANEASDRLVFMSDYRFDGPSPSATLIAGRNLKAYDEWKEVDTGLSLREIYAKRESLELATRPFTG